jgi:hypothetical protein
MKGDSSREPHGGSQHSADEKSRGASGPILKTYQLAFLLTVCTTLLFVLFPTKSNAIVEILFRPMEPVLSRWRPATSAGFIALALAYVFGIWLAVVFCWRRASRDCKLAVVGVRWPASPASAVSRFIGSASIGRRGGSTLTVQVSSHLWCFWLALSTIRLRAN